MAKVIDSAGSKLLGVLLLADAFPERLESHGTPRFLTLRNVIL